MSVRSDLPGVRDVGARDVTAVPRVALVTGATSDIGAAISRALGAGGLSVALGFRPSTGSPDRLADELTAMGSIALPVVADVASVDAIHAAREQVESALGPVSVLVNVAARVRFERFLDSDPTDWAGDIDVTLLGTMRACHAIAPSMKQHGWGRIVNIAAYGAVVGEPALAVASVAKAGVLGLTRTLAKEFGSHGITVNAVAPGFIETTATPRRLREPQRLAAIAGRQLAGRLAEPADIAGTVAYLVGDAAALVTGQVISVGAVQAP